jgi:hypothetical protein
MSSITASGRFARPPEAAAPRQRIFRSASDPDGDCIVVAGWRRGELPESLVDPRFERLGESHDARWSLATGAATFEFEAAEVTLLEPRPGLLAPLLAPFGLRPRDHRVLRVLLWLLRLPGGARALRAWHARRG